MRKCKRSAANFELLLGTCCKFVVFTNLYVPILRVNGRANAGLLNVDRAIILGGLHSVIRKLLAAAIDVGVSYTLSRVSFYTFFLIRLSSPHSGRLTL